MGQMFRKNQLLYNSYTWNRTTKNYDDVPIAPKHVCFPILVLSMDPVSSILEVSQKGGVCFSESTWVVNSGTNENKVYVAAPYSSYHQRLKNKKKNRT